eukprot:11572557-Alexandrium_andersonii.AAC.1
MGAAPNGPAAPPPAAAPAQASAPAVGRPATAWTSTLGQGLLVLFGWVFLGVLGQYRAMLALAIPVVLFLWRCAIKLGMLATVTAGTL